MKKENESLDIQAMPKDKKFSFEHVNLMLQNTLLTKKIKGADDEALEALMVEKESLRGHMRAFIQEIKKQISMCGLDIDLAFGLKVMMEDSKLHLKQLET